MATRTDRCHKVGKENVLVLVVEIYLTGENGKGRMGRGRVCGHYF